VHSQFTPFELDKLNKTKLLDEINHDMAKLQEEMSSYALRYGAEAEKAKAVLTLKISIICMDPVAKQFAVKVESSSTLPKRPADVAVAFIDEDESGKPEMVVRTFAKREEPGPKLPFGTVEGQGSGKKETIDKETGEVLTT
jgi:hypothetical protein